LKPSLVHLAQINKVLGENFYKQIDDSNNSNLYVVNIIDGVISHRLILVD